MKKHQKDTIATYQQLGKRATEMLELMADCDEPERYEFLSEQYGKVSREREQIRRKNLHR